MKILNKNEIEIYIKNRVGKFINESKNMKTITTRDIDKMILESFFGKDYEELGDYGNIRFSDEKIYEKMINELAIFQSKYNSILSGTFASKYLRKLIDEINKSNNQKIDIDS